MTKLRNIPWLAVLLAIFLFAGVANAEMVATDLDKNGTIDDYNAASAVISQARLSTEDVTATNVLTAADTGKVFLLDSATEFATTLPAISTISTGWNCKFIIKAAPASASYTVITGNSLENVIYGGVVERETDTTEDGPSVAGGDMIIFVDAKAIVGDYIDVIFDGAVFYVHGQVNADGAVTLAAAD